MSLGLGYKLFGLRPQELRRELQEGRNDDLRRRRWIVALSLVGVFNMGIILSFQMGIIGHLPDPPIPMFDSVKVNSSETGYALGLPDGAMGALTLAANLPLAAFGGAARAIALPWFPLLFAVKAFADAATGAWYFYQMPAVEKAWCGYCIVGALINISIFVLIVPEARRAWGALRGRVREAAWSGAAKS